VQELNGVILNVGRGIYLAANSNNNTVAGNIVGINTANAAAGNLTHGVEILNSSNNRIGVDVSHANFAAESNIIASNQGNGIFITAQDFFGLNFNSTGNVVAGNYVGTTPTSLVRGNFLSGVVFNAANGLQASDNVIGSNNDGVSDNAEGNFIANNLIGIGTSPTPDINGNKFSRNSVFNNTNLGIDHEGNGVTPNDNGDADTGPNELYNFPVIRRTYTTFAGNLVVSGISRPGSIIEVYIEDGSGEGRTFLFRAQEGTTLNGIADDSTGTASYSDPTYGTFTDEKFGFSVPVSSLPPIPGGARLVALGIKPAVNDSSTSEFGPSLAVLPVTLVTFVGNLSDGTVKLSWTTSREVNSSHFLIEKSYDGVGYKSIGQVNSGNATGQYTFTDNTPLSKANYYRLRPVDVDGNFTYSRVVVIRNDGALAALKLSPNPVSSILNVSFRLEKDETIKLNVYDQSGRLAKRYTVQGGKGLNAFTLTDLNNLPAGTYTVEVTGSSIAERQQIMKK
jgi:hypothetical protein